MGEASPECLDALESRLPSTCTMRRRSAITWGSSGSKVTSSLFLPPPLRKAAPGLVHQGGHVRGLRGDRQRARLDAGHVQQVADHAPHQVGLVGDDAEELAHLRRVQGRALVQQGGGRAPDGGQGQAQLVADHTQELGPQPLQLLQAGQVLHGHHVGHHLPADRSGWAWR